MSKKVFITSATGYIGEAVAQRFKNKGYEVTALTRSDESAARVLKNGFKVHRGDLRKPETFTPNIKEFDIVVHTGATNDVDFGEVDKAVTEAILKELRNTNKTFIYTSGSWVLGNTGGKLADETTPTNPIDIVLWRTRVEENVLNASQHGIRAIVIRPTLVYGNRRGLIEELIESTRNYGEALYAGTGENFWSLVHVEDLADLYVLAAEKAVAGRLFHASENKPIKVAQVIEKVAQVAGVKGKVRSVQVEEAKKTLGFIATAFAVDQQIDSNRARQELGWNPQNRDLDRELQAEKKLVGATK